MAISRIKTSSVLQGFPKSRSLLAGNAAFNPSSYESIATVTVGSAVSSITFSSIPSTYTHLQIRFIAKVATGSGNYFLQFNSDTASNYNSHLLYGSGSSALALADSSWAGINLISGSTTQFSGGVVDILDYTNTNKNKTVRTLGGFDANGSGFVNFYSGLWRNTAAVTSITIRELLNGSNLTQYSQFALYGIKGA
jgi:hypothetical protein